MADDIIIDFDKWTDANGAAITPQFKDAEVFYEGEHDDGLDGYEIQHDSGRVRVKAGEKLSSIASSKYLSRTEMALRLLHDKFVDDIQAFNAGLSTMLEEVTGLRGCLVASRETATGDTKRSLGLNLWVRRLNLLNLDIASVQAAQAARRCKWDADVNYRLLELQTRLGAFLPLQLATASGLASMFKTLDSVKTVPESLAGDTDNKKVHIYVAQLERGKHGPKRYAMQRDARFLNPGLWAAMVEEDDHAQFFKMSADVRDGSSTLVL